jgi:hypothetical protein
MSVEDGWRARRNLMGADSLDELDRWRADNAQRDEELARQSRAEQREQQQSEQQCMVDQLRAEMRRELADIRSELYQQRELTHEVVGTAIGEFADKILDKAENFTREIQNLMFTEIARRFGELAARVEALSGAPSRPRPTKDFRFSHERSDDDVSDLPNPVRKVN